MYNCIRYSVCKMFLLSCARRHLFMICLAVKEKRDINSFFVYYYFFVFFYIGQMYDVRDCVNVDCGEGGFVRCKNCQGVVGVTSGYLIDLFGVVTKRVRNAFMGLQSLCSELTCENPTCVRSVARHGVHIYNERYPLDRLDLAFNCIGNTHAFLSSGRLNPNPLRCVRPEDRVLSRLAFGVEGFNCGLIDAEPNRPLEPVLSRVRSPLMPDELFPPELHHCVCTQMSIFQRPLFQPLGPTVSALSFLLMPVAHPL